MKINKNQKFSPFNIEKAENKYNAKYVGQFSPTISANYAVDVFYQEKPPVKTYSNYFQLFIRDNLVYIADAMAIINSIGIIHITTIEANDGEIIYSRFDHDYQESLDKSVWIDGGRKHVRYPIAKPLRYFTIVDGEWVEI